MKKILMIIMTAIILVACSKEEEMCTSENIAVCEIENIEDFIIEENAKIKIAVFEEAFGEALISSLDSIYPGVYSYDVIDENDVESISDYDVYQTKLENASLLFDDIAPMSNSFEAILNNENISNFTKVINQDEYYFMPFDIKGLLFAYNETFLKELSVDLSDENNDGLADSIDSFEKIGELALKWKRENATYLNKPLETIFSFPFNDQLAMISFIENSNYKLVTGVSGEDIDLEDDLLTALAAYKDLAKYPWSFDEEKIVDMVWNYEEVLKDQSAPFLLVGNWMFYEQYQKTQAYKLKFTKLPTVNEQEISSLSNITGFVLNKNSDFVNAQNQVIKHIRSLNNIEDMINLGMIPLVDPLLLDEIELEEDSNIKDQVRAYTYSHPIELQAFDKNPMIQAYEIYYEVDFRDIYHRLFLADLSVEDAQKEIKERVAVWLDEKDLEVKGINDELEEDNSESE